MMKLKPTQKRIIFDAIGFYIAYCLIQILFELPQDAPILYGEILLKAIPASILFALVMAWLRKHDPK